VISLIINLEKKYISGCSCVTIGLQDAWQSERGWELYERR